MVYHNGYLHSKGCKNQNQFLAFAYWDELFPLVSPLKISLKSCFIVCQNFAISLTNSLMVVQCTWDTWAKLRNRSIFRPSVWDSPYQG